MPTDSESIIVVLGIRQEELVVPRVRSLAVGVIQISSDIQQMPRVPGNDVLGMLSIEPSYAKI
jgi:hypothetical protein